MNGDKPEELIATGTLRLIVQDSTKKGIVSAILGFAVLPLPEGANPGDCIEVRLLEDGAAVWRVVKPGALAKGHPNRVDAHLGRDHSDRRIDILFNTGIVGRACFPEETP